MTVFVKFRKVYGDNINLTAIKGVYMREILLDRRLQDMVIEYLPKKETLDELACFFSVFSDTTRLKIISALAVSEMCVTDISRILRLNQTTVSHQLRLLKAGNVVKTKRQGKIIFYSLCENAVSDILLKGVEFLGY